MFIFDEKDMQKILNELLSNAIKIIKKKGSLESVFFVFGTKYGENALIQVPVGHLKHKEMWKMALETAVKQFNATAAFMVAETWFVFLDKDAPDLEEHTSGRVMPSESPHRKEALLVYGKTQAGLEINELKVFKRDRRNNVVFDDELTKECNQRKEGDDTHIESRFFKDLWPEEEVKQ
jgi:hypothetical protein